MGNKQAPASSIDDIDVGLIDISKAEFYMTEGGFTGLRYNGADHKHITLKRALPVSHPMEYISVADQKNKEIGIIRSVEELNKKQLQIVTNELNSRYYCPEVLEIKSIKDKLGYVYMELRLSCLDGKEHLKSCAIKDVNKNIRMLNDTSLIIFDVDGNRYLVKEISKMDKNSLKRIEPYMF